MRGHADRSGSFFAGIGPLDMAIPVQESRQDG